MNQHLRSTYHIISLTWSRNNSLIIYSWFTGEAHFTAVSVLWLISTPIFGAFLSRRSKNTNDSAEPPCPHLAMLLRGDTRTKIPSRCLLSNIAAGKGVPLRVNATKLQQKVPDYLSPWSVRTHARNQLHPRLSPSNPNETLQRSGKHSEARNETGSETHHETL